MSRKKPPGRGATLLARALSYPETEQTHPWGECAIKVRGKTFLFLRDDDEALSLSVKLTTSHAAALALDYAEPTHYGLGKSGWVTATFKPAARIPGARLERWIDESFRNVAPKKLLATLGGARGSTPRTRKK